MTPQYAARARRRRSACPSFLWVLVLAWAVIMAGSNIARILALPEFLVRTQRVEEVARPPNYYEILGVSPLVDDKTLRRLRRKHNIENHPDKIGDQPEAIKTFLVVQTAFETLTDGRRRCEYDKEHRIKGKWPVQTCRDAFREEYRQIEWERYKTWRDILEEREHTSGNGKGGGPGPSGPHEESGRATSSKMEAKPLVPETGKPSARKPEAKSSRRLGREDERPPGPDAEARMAVPVATGVGADHETTDSVEVVASAVSLVWEGIAELYSKAKARIAHCAGEAFSAFESVLRGAYI